MNFDKEDVYRFIRSDGPVREGCEIEFLNAEQDEVITGMVIKSTYVKEGKEYHVFIIRDNKNDTLKIAKAATVYNNLINHNPGEISKLENK